jgi:hypothetical protein
MNSVQSELLVPTAQQRGKRMQINVNQFLHLIGFIFRPEPSDGQIYAKYQLGNDRLAQRGKSDIQGRSKRASGS